MRASICSMCKRVPGKPHKKNCAQGTHEKAEKAAKKQRQLAVTVDRETRRGVADEIVSLCWLDDGTGRWNRKLARKRLGELSRLLAEWKARDAADKARLA